MSRNGHQGPCDLLAARNRPAIKARQGFVSYTLPSFFFFAVFFFSFVALLRRELVRAREAFGTRLLSPSRSLDRHLTAGYRKELEQREFRLALAIVLLFVLQRDMATEERTATEIARTLTVI